MGSQPIDYALVIRDLEKRREEMNVRFDAAIAAMRQVLAIQATGSQGDISTSLPFMPGARLLPYRKMSMIEAAIAHIKTVGHGVPNVELAKAVETGGFPHKSKNFPNTLNSVLWRRAKTVKDIRKSDSGWEIIEPVRGINLRASNAERE